MSEEEFLLKWNNHQTNFVDVFNELLRDESFVDVTLVCGGEAVPGHKMVLAACSPLLHRILRDNPCKHPLVILSDVPARDMRAMMKFIYQGEVSVSQTELASFLKTADNLQIKGLAEDKEKEKEERKRKDKDGDKTEGRVSNKRQRTAEPRTTENSSPLPSRSHKALNDSHSSSHKSRSKASAEEHTPRVGGGGLHMPASKHNSSKNSSSKSPRDIPSRVSNASEENSLQHAVNNNSVTEDVLPKEEMVDVFFFFFCVPLFFACLFSLVPHLLNFLMCLLSHHCFLKLSMYYHIEIILFANIYAFLDQKEDNINMSRFFLFHLFMLSLYWMLT